MAGQTARDNPCPPALAPHARRAVARTRARQMATIKREKQETHKAPSRRAARVSYHKGHVAEDLKTIARRLIDSEGLDSVTLRRLCREVGVTAANFYNHYPSLEHLLLDIAADGAAELSTRTLRLMRRAKSREEKLVELAIEFVEFGLEFPDLFRIMYGQINGSRDHAAFQLAMEGSFAQLVELIYGADLYRPNDVAWSHAQCPKAYAFFSFCYGAARLVSMQLFTFPTGTKAERQRFVRELSWIFVKGLDGPAPPIN
ncbi:TetR/AcrR family transcriptional regulator [Rubrivivax albus]|uniref:TetR/AcrR family transcriptional regulator n=2 Tax=Rubrivivax albus TaxID=2499835 RepID=A0A3S2WUE7_9BURK|nr:TetR/AcrR family transcriptional regulator [Rubrivivax albus]